MRLLDRLNAMQRQRRGWTIKLAAAALGNNRPVTGHAQDYLPRRTDSMAKGEV